MSDALQQHGDKKPPAPIQVTVDTTKIHIPVAALSSIVENIRRGAMRPMKIATPGRTYADGIAEGMRAGANIIQELVDGAVQAAADREGQRMMAEAAEAQRAKTPEEVAGEGKPTADDLEARAVDELR